MRPSAVPPAYLRRFVKASQVRDLSRQAPEYWRLECYGTGYSEIGAPFKGDEEDT